MKTLQKILKEIGAQKYLFILSLALSLVSVYLSLYIPTLFGNAIDMLLDPAASLSPALKHIVVLIVLTSAVTWLMNLLNNHITFTLIQRIRNKMVQKIQRLPLKFLDAHASGDLVSRMIADAETLSDGLLLGFSQLFTGIMTIFITLYFMFTKSFVITMFVLCMTPVSFLAAKFIASRSYKMFRLQNETRGNQTALTEEMITNLKTVKAFGYEDRASERFAYINANLQNYSQNATFYSSLTNPSTRAVNNVIYAVVALIGTYSILKGNLTVGGLTILLTYANQYMKPFNDISSVITELQNSISAAERIFYILEADEETDAVPVEEKKFDGDVTLDNVAFSYVPEKPFIENFNLSARKGTRIAIVGPTGCGKTTLINLLMRFYDIQSGDILIDGTSIYSINRQTLRQSFGMVLQETWLKEGTIRENLMYGNPNATEEELIGVAKKTHCWEFIHRLPQQLDTHITDDSLSAGQKQLLCIARVMLTSPSILILDEATSAIDTRTELYVQHAFDQLMTGRTSFIVAHRLSTIRNADLILVMKDGKIIERGTHDELLQQNGFYTNLYQSQFAANS